MGAATVHNSTVSGFHGCSAVALIRANSARTAVRPSNSGRAGLPLQFTEDCFLMGEKVLDQAVAVAFVHRKAALKARPKDALGQRLGER